MAKWHVRVTGKQRKNVDVNLVVQAVIALGHQLAEEERAARAESAEEVTGASPSVRPKEVAS